MASLVDNTGKVIIPHLEIADRFWQRFIGLQFRRQLPPNSGLCITPCSSIHTCFMRFPIDVWMLDRHGVVLKCKRNVQPWRFVIAPRGTRCIVETMSDAVSLAEGTLVEVRR